MNKSHIFMLIVGLMLFFSIEIMNANTICMGKIYDSNFSQVIPNAEIIVNCNGSSLSTTSLSDGAYAVIFDTPECDNSIKIEINALKGKWSGKGSSIINSSKGEVLKIVVVNINMKENPVVEIEKTIKIFKKHGNNYFLCGNGICDSGEKESTCPEDCTVIPKKTIVKKSPTEPIILNNEGNQLGVTQVIMGFFGSKSSALILSTLTLLLIMGILGIVLNKKLRG